MTPSLRMTTVLFLFLALCSCSSPKLEEIKGLPERGQAGQETKSEATANKDTPSAAQPQDANGSTVPSSPIEPLPLAPPPTEPGPPPVNGQNGSNGGLNIYEEPNGKVFERTQTGVSQTIRKAPPKIEVTDSGLKIPELPPLELTEGEAVEATIINPYRTANIGTEVSGLIDRFDPEEGDLVRAGQVVCEISRERYTLMAQKAAEEVKGLELATSRAERNLQIIQDMLAQEASTKQDLLKAQTEFEMAKVGLEKAIKEKHLAELNLESCQVIAPYKGYIAVKYKQAFEPIDRMEKIFAIVDTEKVFAVANMPESQLASVKKGVPASFIDSLGIKHMGNVEKMGAMIDPKSRTKRVWVLINNSNGQLIVGMVGTLQIEKPEDE
ncbi:MAG: efflux RND transporter periplasmic adaptor subunit [Pseudomonadota bacterium]